MSLIKYFIVVFFPEVMQARGQMSKGERAAHQKPIHFFPKVCLRSITYLNSPNPYQSDMNSLALTWLSFKAIFVPPPFSYLIYVI